MPVSIILLLWRLKECLTNNRCTICVEVENSLQRFLFWFETETCADPDLAGASVFRGLMGYGANSRIHTAKLIDLSCDLPVLIEIVDSEEYIAKILPYLDEVIQEGLVTIDDIEIIKYGKTTSKR